MNSIDLKMVIKRSSDLVSSNMDGETVMMSVENGEYYGLDPIGSRIWELLENPIEVNVLIETLLEEFEVSKEQCTEDTLEFLNQLHEKNLLLIIPPK